MLGFVALALSAVGFLFPEFLPGNGSALFGIIILTCTLFCWRGAYGWMVKQPFLRERVYVLGTGERAERLVNGLRERSTMGIEVVGWTGDVDGELTRDSVASHLLAMARGPGVHRVIVAMPDRRGTLAGGRIAGPAAGRLESRRSNFLAGENVRENRSRAVVPELVDLCGWVSLQHFLPAGAASAEFFGGADCADVLAASASVHCAGRQAGVAGSCAYRQQRVGRRGKIFYCYKFRTMRQDAEADTGATWAADDDPRITRVGKFLRSSRLDEIPQLWCVLKGDMHFVGPRPERPEFVEWLSKEIPYYGVRHVVRPGITGWAQVQYKYGNTLEDAREKLQYDLFYIKNASLGLDLLIMFQTIKIVLLGRGAQ